MARPRRSTSKRVTRSVPTEAVRPAAPNGLFLPREVQARVRLSQTAMARLNAKGRFPRRIKIDFKHVTWRAAEIDTWVAIGAGGVVPTSRRTVLCIATIAALLLVAWAVGIFR
jgi:predicted DNA-binding transcriptional regulator AlpA